MDEKIRHHVTLVLPTSLDETRRETSAASFTGLLRDLPEARGPAMRRTRRATGNGAIGRRFQDFGHETI